MPYELSSWILGQWGKVSVSTSTVCNWVQHFGSKAQQVLSAQLEAQASGDKVPCEPLSEALAALPLAIAADGVMVPFRPTAKTTKGKIQ